MTQSKPQYTKVEFAARGDEIYERVVRPTVEPGRKGSFVAIDIESGAHEVASDEFSATDKLLARVPDSQIWMRKVGSPYVRRLRSQISIWRAA
ncbi:MAG: hypothetical protein HYS13_08435 [Planctomycetia bacterium]|nr:hypothetical protein [Planctomycetia bacterium]